MSPDDDTYLGYLTEMTRQAHVGVDIAPRYNKMVVEGL
jgi:hypothetical protein